MNTEVIAKEAADSIDSLVRQYVQGSHGQNKDQIQSVIHSAIEKACANLPEPPPQKDDSAAKPSDSDTPTI
jgi:hypothetical protein